MTTRHFEVVVLGGSAHALAVAALLARRGIRGLVVDQGELSEHTGGLLEDLTLTEDGSPGMELLHSELGLGHEMRRRSRPLAAGLQVVLPDQRFDLPPERPALLAEVNRALGPSACAAAEEILGEVDRLDHEAGELLAAIGTLPPRGFFARRHANQVLRRHPRLLVEANQAGYLDGPKEEITRILAGFLPFASHGDAVPERRLTVLRFVRLVARLMKGVQRIEGGPNLREVLLEAAERNGFTVLRSAVEAVEPGKRVHRLSLVKGDETITTECLVDASMDLSGLGSIPPKARARGLAELLQGANPRGHLHALELAIDPSALPPGMGQQVLLMHDRRLPRPDGAAGTAAEERQLLLLVRTLTPKRVRLLALYPLGEARAHIEDKARLDRVMRQRLLGMIPFLDEAELPAAEGEERSAAVQVRHPLFDPELDPLLGVAGVSTLTPHKHVFVGGPAVLPGLGIEAVYLGALEVADEVEAALGRAKKSNTLSGRLLARNAAVAATPKRA